MLIYMLVYALSPFFAFLYSFFLWQASLYFYDIPGMSSMMSSSTQIDFETIQDARAAVTGHKSRFRVRSRGHETTGKCRFR